MVMLLAAGQPEGFGFILILPLGILLFFIVLMIVLLRRR